MPLEDLEALGYDVQRPPETDPHMSIGSVWGFDRSWTALEPEDEDRIIIEATNHAKLVGKMEQAQDYFQDNFANWPTMTAQQKDTANRQAQRALANLIRHVRKDMTSEGI
jgi:hypothetical protein